MVREFTYKPFGLRMNNQLREWLKDRANANGRSMNSEILQLLEAIRQNHLLETGQVTRLHNLPITPARS